MVDGHREDAVPRTLLHGDLRPQSLDEVVALLRRQTAKLDVHALAPQGGYPSSSVSDEEGAVAIEIGFAALPVVGIALTHQVGAADMFDKYEGARAHDVVLIPVHILG